MTEIKFCTMNSKHLCMHGNNVWIFSLWTNGDKYFVCRKKALGHVIQGYLRVVEASGVWIRRVSVLRWSHFDICWCSASLLQGLARIWDLTSSYTITWGGKKRQILSFYKYKELPWQMIYSVCEWMIAHLSVNLSSAWSLEPSQPARRLKVQVQVISGLLSLDSKLSHSI